MRLGKEQAAGYVEDTVDVDTPTAVADPTAAETIRTDSPEQVDFPERVAPTPVPEPATVVG